MIELRPFHPGAIAVDLAANFRVRGRVCRLDFALSDGGGVVVGADARGRWEASTARREAGLWTSTCFEAFWAVPGVTAYWELNLAPQGCWNLYEFEGYRGPQPPVESRAWSLREYTVEAGRIACVLEGRLGVPRFDVGLAAVLASRDGALHYYALAHPGGRPDFHRRDTFVLRREDETAPRP